MLLCPWHRHKIFYSFRKLIVRLFKYLSTIEIINDVQLHITVKYIKKNF